MGGAVPSALSLAWILVLPLRDAPRSPAAVAGRFRGDLVYRQLFGATRTPRAQRMTNRTMPGFSIPSTLPELLGVWTGRTRVDSSRRACASSVGAVSTDPHSEHSG